MNMNEIIETHEKLERDLRVALSTMEKKSTIYQIKEEISKLQQMCPHYSEEYNFTVVDEHCPYCGKKMN